MGRPRTLLDDDVVAIRATGESHLQHRSDRRAIINLLVDNGGRMTVNEINLHFGFDITAAIRGLIRSGWLEVSE